MTDLADIQQRIDEADFDSIEDIWLERIAVEPSDHDFFIGVAQALVSAEEQERAAFLVDLLEDHIQEAGDWSTRLEILRQLNWLYPDVTRLHATILDTVRSLYEDSPSLEGVIEKVGLLRAIEDIPKTWTKVDKLRQILQFEVGEPVWMEGKGAGRVIEVNLDLDSFKVDLEHQPGLRVGFRAAAKLLQPLPAGHFLRRKLENPEGARTTQGREPGRVAPVSAAQLSRAALGRRHPTRADRDRRR